MYTKLGDTIRVCFGTANAGGAAQDADSLPVVTVLDQGVAMGYSPTVVNKATGLYEVAIVTSSGNGFTEGHSYSVFVTAIVGGTTHRDGVTSFFINSDNATAVLTRLGTPAGASVSADIAGIRSIADALQITTNELHKIGVGRWKIANNQLTLYDINGVTPLFVFDLLDDVGNPSMTKVFERVPV